MLCKWRQGLMGSHFVIGEINSGDPNGIRTRVTAVKGRCPGPLDDRVAKVGQYRIEFAARKANRQRVQALRHRGPESLRSLRRAFAQASQSSPCAGQR